MTEWLMVYQPDKSASFVGVERIKGVIDGRRGSLVLQQTSPTLVDADRWCAAHLRETPRAHVRPVHLAIARRTKDAFVRCRRCPPGRVCDALAWLRPARQARDEASDTVRAVAERSATSGDEVVDATVRAVAFNRLGASAVLLDGDGVIVDTNESWRLFTSLNDGVPARVGRGVSYLDVCDRAALTGDDDAATVAAGLRQILRGERDHVDLEYPCPSPTEDRWFLMQAASAPVADGAGVVLFHVDITARKALSDRLAVLADDDELTGLPNRRSAIRYLDRQLDGTRGSGEPVWILFLDLDRFKEVNDRHGHHVGDELLVKVAARARRVLREDDRLCRLGGDEFVLICPGLDRTKAVLLAHRLRTVMAAPFQIGHLEIIAGVSIGVAGSHPDATTESMLRDADTDMYVDKRGAPHRRSISEAVAEAPPAPARSASAELFSMRSRTVPPSSVSGDVVSELSIARARADAAFAHSSDLVMFFGMDGIVLSASPSCRQVFGVEPDELVGLNGFNMIHPDDQEHVLLDFLSIPNLGDTVRTEFRILDAAGDVRWMEEIATNLVDDPNVGCVVGNLRDVTERVELLRRIETEHQRLADAQASARMGSFEFDPDTGELHHSDELCRMLGVEPGPELKLDDDFIHPDDHDHVYAAFERAIAGADQHDLTYRIVRADGVVRWVRAQVARIEPTSSIIIGTVLDITERHEAEAALAHQATHDWLTQLPNAANLHECLQSSLSSPDGEGLVAVAMVDIDHFKLVNDHGGHAMGDEILRSVASRLREGLPATDVVARLGGDEFVVVRTGMTDLDEANGLGEQVLALFDDRATARAKDRRLTVSVGVALSTPTDSPTSLLRDADEAMYHAKRLGRDRLTVFDSEARARAHRRQRLTVALPLALERDEFHVAYQPILRLDTLEVAGFEALLRWRHPELGPISPVEFIPIAEENGFILPLGKLVLDHATHQLAQWCADPAIGSDLWMAINVSAPQLTEPHFADLVARTIAHAGVAPGSVHLEITESVLMEGIEHALRTIDELRAVGVHISIDDFGTGYSSFSYLSRLPVDTIKIDRSFVSELGQPGHGFSIVATMVALANTLGLAVVAEGVELLEQVHALQGLGCDFGQGFYWSPAIGPADVRGWIDDHARRTSRMSHPSQP